MSKMHHSISILSALILLFNCVDSSAQVNDTIFRYDVSATATINRGNLDQTLFNTNVLLSKSNNQVGFRLKTNSFHQWLNGIMYDADYYGTLVGFYKPLSVWSPYIVVRYEQSQRRAIESRWMGGLGLSYLHVFSPQNKIRFNASMLYDDATFSDVVSFYADKKHQNWRPTFVVYGIHNLLKNSLHIGYECWLQSSTQALSDLRYQADVNMDLKIYKQLYFRIKAFYTYETNLPQFVKQGDLRSSFGVVLKN